MNNAEVRRTLNNLSGGMKVSVRGNDGQTTYVREIQVIGNHVILKAQPDNETKDANLKNETKIKPTRKQENTADGVEILQKTAD